MHRTTQAIILLCAGGWAKSQNTFTISDDRLSATFNTRPANFGGLMSLKSSGSSNVLETGGMTSAIWSASFVGVGTGTTTVSSTDAKCDNVSVKASSTTSLTLQWVGCLANFVTGTRNSSSTIKNQTKTASLTANATWVEHDNSSCSGQCLSIHSKGPNGGNCDRMPGCGHDAGLPYCDPEAMKARCLSVPGCTAFNTNGYLYAGGGVVPYSNYPLQCYTYGPPPPPPGHVDVTLSIELVDGLLQYGIAFTGNGTVSLWDYSLALAQIRTSPSSKALTSTAARQLIGVYDAASASATDAVYFAAHDKEHIMKTCSTGAGALSCKMLALNATLPLYNYTAAFPIVITVLPGGDWWDLTQTYRKWVLPNAVWTQLGPLETRSDMPDWLENITLWMNNNWGGDPLGPNYGGDPEYVKNEMLKVNAVLNLPSHGGHLALHWYEWDTLGYALGSNHTKCDRHPAPCGFDTHYPNYFPARVACKESVKAMHEAGMRVIPYINGQLYDTLIPRWTEENASLYVQKFAAETMRTDTNEPALTPHLEHFDGITSAVMCPVTDYWHAVMRDTVLQIVNEVGFDGCYVDQVGNGEVRNCADPTHNHSINGGAFWAEAFYKIMGDVRAAIPPKSGMFMTEGTIEQVSGPGFDILLGLEWTALPIWHAIYGGYGYATGRAGSITSPLGGGLCTELTKQFMVGGTMGWFTYQNYGNQFFDPANANEVAFIQARIAGKKWMVHGRATRTLVLNDSPVNTLLGGCFLRDAKSGEAASVVCSIASPTTASATYALDMVPARYGLVVPAGSHVLVRNVMTGAVVGTYSTNVTVANTVSAFDVVLLELTVAQ